jgi:hypothetical protein
MKSQPDRSFAAYVGVDWADSKHDFCLQAADSDRREPGVVAHTPEAIVEWAGTLRCRFAGPIAVCLEISKGPLINALQRYDFFVIFPVNPSMLAKYREAFTPSGAKDDPTDASAAEVQQYSGIAPVVERSGNKCWTHWRLACPTFLRQTFIEWAGATIPRSFWAAAYYRQQTGKGCSHRVAVRALAFKWIRILYRCWRDRVAYDETTYLNALRRRGSPLLKTT